MKSKTVGAFEIRDGALYGPAEYMREQGNDKVERILAGNDVVFNVGCVKSPDVETALLVALQTDYAGWKGTRQLLASLKSTP